MIVTLLIIHYALDAKFGKLDPDSDSSRVWFYVGKLLKRNSVGASARF